MRSRVRGWAFSMLSWAEVCGVFEVSCKEWKGQGGEFFFEWAFELV